MKSEGQVFTATIDGLVYTFETGKVAGQAGGAVTLRAGDTMVLAAVTMSNEPRPGIDFVPLSVDYEERMYAGGRIPGSFFRREGRPGEEAILTSRLTDRPLRPLFAKDLRHDVQVILYALSTDTEHPIDIMTVTAASAALTISDIPWAGPVAAVRVGFIDGNFVSNPTFELMSTSSLDLRLAGTKDAILMVECGANELKEEVMVAALEFGHKALQPLIEAQERMKAAVGKPKRQINSVTVNEDLRRAVAERVEEPINALLDKPYIKSEFQAGLEQIKVDTMVALANDDDALAAEVAAGFETAYKNITRRRILERGIRLDGRGTKDIRNIWCEVNFSPRAHGSGLFTRGETQVLTLATLGTPREAQELDNLTPADSKRYMHHYNFPPFCTGEVKPLRGTGRREVGHGALAERALIPVLPPEAKFPYTLRLVSEVLSSNGSSSMASVCGSTLALMDTGVPIKAPVAGVAMGLIKEGEKYSILTDILGSEDHLGDMDFKVAGTAEGITALQMDIKMQGLDFSIMSQALEQARGARLAILDKILEVIPEPRADLKDHAPRITIVTIPVDKIGAVIGPGGKVIRSIQDETGVKIDIGEDGSVFIASSDGESAKRARERVEALTESAVAGRIYTGKVVRITEFGAFVEILPNLDGLVHISQLDSQRVEKVEDIVRLGDEITVMVTDIDSQGKIRLSRQAVLEGWTLEEAAERDRGRSSKPGGQRGGRSDDRRGGSGGSNRPRR